MKIAVKFNHMKSSILIDDNNELEFWKKYFTYDAKRIEDFIKEQVTNK